MALTVLLAVCVGTVLAANNGTTDKGTYDVDFLMQEVAPKVPDTYLCIPMEMKDTPEYIVGFKPHADMAIAHHILLYGCKTPGRDDRVWNCGEMAAKGKSSFKSGQVCGSGSKILYAWAMDAPSLTLPKDVGFKVGGDTGIDYLVLQVHYKNVTGFLPPFNGKDNSGITMTMTEKPQPRRAGVYLIGTSGAIPSHSVTYMESQCRYNENFVVHPFAFRTHAHSLGKVTSGYRIRNGRWTEIGRMSPQRPQMFYNSTTPGLEIRRGDILAARCTMKNDLDHTVRIGSTQNDEMCNFYMMYYTDDAKKIMSDTYCFSAGPPRYYWATDNRMKDKVQNIPDDASLVPGERQPLVQTAKKGLYVSKPKQTDIYSEIKNLDMNIDPASLGAEDFAALIDYLQNRGPRAYEDEYYY